MAYGVTATGFAKKRLSDIKSELENELRSKLGNQINLLPTSVLSQLVGCFADREASLWELAEDVYDSQYPDSATGVALDNVLELSNLQRLGATKSRVNFQHLFGTPNTVVPLGTQISVDGNPNLKFLTLADATLGAGVDEVQKLTFSATPTGGVWKLSYRSAETSNLAFNANAAAVQAALLTVGLTDVTVLGNYATGFTVTFGGVDGKQDQPLLGATHSLVNGVTPIVMTLAEDVKGVAQATVAVSAVNTGPVIAPAFTLTVIDTPVSGLTRTINLTDATVGRDIETDLEARIRRRRTLQIAGAGTFEAIRSRLLALEGVTDAILFENDAAVTVNGRPPHSYEAVINGGEEADIKAAIWESKPAGIKTFGNQTSTVTDSQSVTRTVYWSRPTTIPIYVSIDLTTDFNFPANGVDVAKQAIVDFGDALGISADVIVYPQLVAALDEIPGITDMKIRLGTAPVSTVPGAAAVDDNIAVASNEITDWDTSRVSINVL